MISITKISFHSDRSSIEDTLELYSVVTVLILHPQLSGKVVHLSLHQAMDGSIDTATLSPHPHPAWSQQSWPTP